MKIRLSGEDGIRRQVNMVPRRGERSDQREGIEFLGK
jgi:hypothetical protein